MSTSLLGQPVSIVRRELRGLGLVVHVQPRPDQQAAPGTVLRLYPTGQVPVGSVVLVTAATRPAPAPTAPASTAPASSPPASGTPAPSASATTKSTKHSSPGRTKHGKGPPPGHG